MLLLNAIEPMPLEIVPLVVEELFAGDQGYFDLLDPFPGQGDPIGDERIPLEDRGQLLLLLQHQAIQLAVRFLELERASKKGQN